MKIVKGSDCKFHGIAYMDDAKTILANLVAAQVKLFVKAREKDTDAQALFTVAGIVTSTSESTFEATMPASITNSINYSKVVAEIVIKLADGSFIRSGVQELTLDQNVGKTLF